MLTFRQYITEIFDTPTGEVPHHHPDYEFVPGHPGSLYSSKKTHVYRGHIKDDDAEYRLRFFARMTEDDVSDVEFTVNHLYDAPNQRIPTHHAFAIGNKLNEYFHHHMMTVKPRMITYDTDDLSKHRIYQGIAERYGVTARNLYLGKLRRTPRVRPRGLRGPPETPESTSP